MIFGVEAEPNIEWIANTVAGALLAGVAVGVALWLLDLLTGGKGV